MAEVAEGFFGSATPDSTADCRVMHPRPLIVWVRRTPLRRALTALAGLIAVLAWVLVPEMSCHQEKEIGMVERFQYRSGQFGIS